MNPVAFELFGVSVRWYGILIGMGMLLGTMIGMKEAKRLGYEEETLLDVLIIALPSAIIGARFYYVIFNLDLYDTFWEMINIRSGGLAIHGGVLAAIFSFWIISKVKKLDFWVWLDIAAPSIILGQAVGRWGNFINQEAHGGETDLPWGIMVDGLKVHPTFLYESLGNILIFFFLRAFRKKKKFEGHVFAYYMIGYSIIRFFIEGLRTDSLYFGPLRVAQMVSILFAGLGVLIIVINKKKIKKV